MGGKADNYWVTTYKCLGDVIYPCMYYRALPSPTDWMTESPRSSLASCSSIMECSVVLEDRYGGVRKGKARREEGLVLLDSRDGDGEEKMRSRL